MKKLSNIFRIDIHPSPDFPHRHPTHGWQVRVRRQGKQHTKFFSDDRHGGSDSAVKQALKYRNQLIDELPQPDDPARKSAIARSKTGVIGLSFGLKDDGSGKQKPYVQVSWITPEGRRRGTAFSVEKWGLRRAVWNACLRLYRERSLVNPEESKPEEMFREAFPRVIEHYEKLPGARPLPPQDYSV
jgi:hypothetical protein